MNCPNCSNQLSQRAIRNILLDACDNGCGGIWFDQFEFEKFDEQNELNAEALLNVKIDVYGVTESKPAYNCPKCNGITMMRHFYSKEKQVSIDECPQCAGIWLDAGELTEIRNEEFYDDDRRVALEKVFLSTFDAGLKKLRSARQKK